MSKTGYLAELERRLEQLETRMAADKAKLDTGALREKVEAAGDLAVAERRVAETKQKIARLEAEPEGTWENFKAEIEEDFDFVESALDRWAERDA